MLRNTSCLVSGSNPVNKEAFDCDEGNMDSWNFSIFGMESTCRGGKNMT